jgi:murein L,D-transpeptidase YcbB/YkuD
MEYVVFRPYWSVPYSIARAEFLPRIARDPDYLAKKGFEVVNSRQDVVTSGTVTSDVLEQLRAGKLRLEKPADLAVWVLRNNPSWSLENVRSTMNGATTQQVNLAHPIPVLILYATVIVIEDGIVHFYDDIYGHDAALKKVLEKGYAYSN